MRKQFYGVVLLLLCLRWLAGVALGQVSPTVGGGHYIELKWQPPTGYSVTSTAITYTAYRGTSQGGESVTPVKQGMYCMTVNGGEDGYCHWNDQNVTHGVTYWYAVEACLTGTTTCSSTAETLVGTTAK